MKEKPVHSLDDLWNKYLFKSNEMKGLPLWHYTSADGFCGIIRNKQEEHGKLHFWFTRSDCLNDTSEGSHVLDLFHEICSELLNRKKISQDFYDLLRGVTIPDEHFISYNIPQRGSKEQKQVMDRVSCHAFICSFSLKADSLDMWRYYSKANTGVALALSPKIFTEYIDYHYAKCNNEEVVFCAMDSFKVVYDSERKRTILNDLVCDLYSVYCQPPQSENIRKENVIQMLQYYLRTLQFRFKHDCYSSEEEFRFVFYLPNQKPEPLKDRLPEVQFRTQNGLIIPYIDLAVKCRNAHLYEVLISPYSKNSASVTAINDYLVYCALNPCAKQSVLPVRF